MSTLPILTVEDDVSLNEDEECSARQIVRHVCVALKRYLEAHLYIRSEQLRRTHLRENGGETAKYHSTLPSYKVNNFLCWNLNFIFNCDLAKHTILTILNV